MPRDPFKCIIFAKKHIDEKAPYRLINSYTSFFLWWAQIREFYCTWKKLRPRKSGHFKRHECERNA